MRKKKLILNKETVKNLTLTNEELGGVVGGGYTGGSTNWCPNTGSTCHSCGGSCLVTVCGCGFTETFTPKINPTFMPGG